ncbi:hypothetical protein SAMN05216175_109123 [Neptunomonas qingdaonensis]|uniref:Uncharacterized protein n=2 Tax=Neptunomonas qingdaonensis TaxID=1045558 RepID=A0A1I2T7J1_9GAMM|nr:hypothetical protein SAMN05216175_109123 [Neptunomonas qingdaonensis]
MHISYFVNYGYAQLIWMLVGDVMSVELKALVLEHSGFDAAISGGNGRTIETAIIIHQDGIRDKRTVQIAILWALGRNKQLSWDILGASVDESSGRFYESVLLGIRLTDISGQVKQGQQTIYFDTTEYMRNK